jgi:hypothetical protein
VGVLVVLLMASAVDRPVVALTYSREGSASDCPPAARLGYVPFSPVAPTRLDVALDGSAELDLAATGAGGPFRLVSRLLALQPF